MKPTITVEMLDTILTFQQMARFENFQAIFGEELAHHLWMKFIETTPRRNLLNFYRWLDARNAQALADGLTAAMVQTKETRHVPD